MNIFHVYTDGACKNNPGVGGYAYTVYDDLGEIWIKGSGVEKETTNNRMELTAVIQVLKKIISDYNDYKITIYSDSAYVVNCFKDNWIGKWKQNNWKTYNKKDVLNKELWEILDELVIKTNASFENISRKDSKIKEVDLEAKMAIKKLN